MALIRAIDHKFIEWNVCYNRHSLYAIHLCSPEESTKEIHKKKKQRKKGAGFRIRIRARHSKCRNDYECAIKTPSVAIVELEYIYSTEYNTTTDTCIAKERFSHFFQHFAVWQIRMWFIYVCVRVCVYRTDKPSTLTRIAVSFTLATLPHIGSMPTYEAQTDRTHFLIFYSFVVTQPPYQKPIQIKRYE